MKAPSLEYLPDRWRRSPRRWGHSLHTVCSYFAMFPPQVPHVFIRWLTEPGDVVYDPFSGRGTTVLEACRMGRVGYGSDANPLAWVLTGAKADPPTPGEAEARLKELRVACEPMDPEAAPDNIRMLYHRDVLGQLLWLRETLDPTDRTDRFILALLLGVMHANYKPGKLARGLSISMPNTFSMAPGYVRKYIDEHDLQPPDISVFDLLDRKMSRLDLPLTPTVRGRAWLQDVRGEIPPFLLENPAKLVFTSPPYLGVIKYGKYNWIRLWLLKQEPKAVDAKLVATASPTRYLAFIKDSLEALAPSVRDDGYLCLMIGDVARKDTGDTVNLAGRVWDEVAAPLGWHRVAEVVDRLPTKHKVSRIWKNSRGHATKIDRILVLAKDKKAAGALPGLGPIRWTTPTDWS